ncbi:MAG: hypothetical protein EBT48_07775, partial [Verrucomicrobia bacterium]|nr:hypothetical protein [Verrucomicrobiota bacterium]
KRDTAPKRATRPSRDDWMAYAKTIAGWPLSDAEKAFDYYEANGWKVGGRAAVVDWKACARNCSRRSSDAGVKSQPPRPVYRSQCESPREQPINYNSESVVVGLIRTAVKEGYSLEMIKASTPAAIWEKAFQLANAKEAACHL